MSYFENPYFQNPFFKKPFFQDNPFFKLSFFKGLTPTAKARHSNVRPYKKPTKQKA